MVVDSMVSRRVRVNGTRSLQEALSASALIVQNTLPANCEVPRGTSDEAEVIFFWLGNDRDAIQPEELMGEYERRHLVPVDPYALAAVNEQELEFAKRYPSVTQWRDRTGAWYSMRYNRRIATTVSVDQCRLGHGMGWWYAGVRA